MIYMSHVLILLSNRIYDTASLVHSRLVLLLTANLEVLAPLHRPQHCSVGGFKRISAYAAPAKSNHRINWQCDGRSYLDGVHVHGFADVTLQPQHDLLRGLCLHSARNQCEAITKLQ